MSALPDAFGSAEYRRLLAMCGVAEDCHAAYDRTGRLPDLQRALALFGAVLSAARNVDIRGAALNGVGMVLWSRYERFGEPDDLDEAIALFRQALALYGDEVTVTTPSYSANLAGALQLRWLRHHDVEDLTASIDAIRTAVRFTTPGNPRRSSRLNILGTGMLDLFRQHQDSAALAEGIENLREAVACAQDGGDSRTWACANLAEALRQHHVWAADGDLNALDEATHLARSVLAATPSRHPLRPRFLASLAVILLGRFQARGEPSDLDEAARSARRAVTATPKGHPNRAERTCILAAIEREELMCRLGLDGATMADAAADGPPVPGLSPVGLGPLFSLRAVLGRRPRRVRRALRRVLHAAGDATAAVPEGHVLRGPALISHGNALAVKAVAEGDPHALAEAIARFRDCALDPTTTVSVRITSARLWAISAGWGMGHADWAAAMEPLRLAVELLPRTAPHRIARTDRQRQLGDFAGLASDAAACAIELGDPELAVQLLEEGRGVLLGQVLDTRTEVTDLHERLPELAHRFEELRIALDRPEDADFTSSSLGTVTGRTPDTPLTGEDRHAVAEEWERLMGSIRQQPGFENFLRPPHVSNLLSETAGHGPVVMVNVSALRCDALVLSDRSVRSVPLYELSYPEAVRRTDAFLAAVGRAGDTGLPMGEQREAQREVRKTFAWLWTAVAEPVLTALGITPQPPGESSELGRLWWVPTGPLTALPLHAAGPHEASRDGVLDRVVSSYAPTVRSLTHAWQQATRPHRQAGDLVAPLVLALPKTPGAADLPGALEEVALLARMPDSQVLTGERAVRQAVLDALPHHHWVHFACHAVSVVDGASSGHVLLHDHRTAPLTVADISRLRLGSAELVYLSACETTRGRRELADEAVHVTGAFHMAGFIHVIGTLWVVDDEVSLDVVKNFYEAFAASRPFAAQAARVLHDAVLRVRDAYPKTPTLWAPYLHVGA